MCFQNVYPKNVIQIYNFYIVLYNNNNKISKINVIIKYLYMYVKVDVVGKYL